MAGQCVQDIAGPTWEQCRARWCSVSSPQAPATPWCSSMRLTSLAEVLPSALLPFVMSCCVFFVLDCLSPCGMWLLVQHDMHAGNCALAHTVLAHIHCLPKFHAAGLVAAHFAAFWSEMHDRSLFVKVQISGHHHYLPPVQHLPAMLLLSCNF